MSGGDIAAACTLGPAFLVILGFFLQCAVEAGEHKLWPRGLRWFPVWWINRSEQLHRLGLRIFWPEKLPAYKGHRLLRLEDYDQQWRTWNGCAGITGPPVWKPWNEKSSDHGRWVPRNN